MAEKEKAEKGKTSFEDVVAKLHKKYGAGCVSSASTAKAIQSYRRIETGIFALDYATGGGIPHGQATLFYGAEAGGKSVTAIKTMAAAQRMCKECVVKMVQTGKELNRCPGCGYRGKEDVCPQEAHVKLGKQPPAMSEKTPELVCPECKKHKPHWTLYMDAEGAFTMEWGARHGLDCTLVYVSQPESAQEAMDGSMMLLETGKFDVVVVDSIAQLVPLKELEESSEKWQQGELARLVNKALRGWVSSMNKSGVERLKRVTFLLVNQVRMKIGVMFGDPTTKPGGKGQDYAVVLQLKMWGGKYEQDDLGNTLGVVTCFKIQKNKTAPTSQQEGNFRLWLRDCAHEGEEHRVGDTEEDRVLMEYGLKFGVIKNDGKKYEVAGKTSTSQAGVRELIVKDPEVFAHVRRALLGMLVGDIWYSLAEQEKAKKKAEKYD